MPPRAIAMNDESTTSRARASPVRSACCSRKSSAIAAGNFGARPSPPCTGSCCATIDAAARASVSASTPSPLPGGASCRSYSSRSDATVSPTRSRRSRHASATEASTRRKLGSPWRSSGGKYVPPKNGSPSGVRNTVIGHPPCPVIACTACM